MLRRTLDRVLRASFSVTSTSYGSSTPRLLSSSVASRVVGASFSSSSMISTAGAKIPVRRGNAQNNRFSSFASASPRSRSVTPAMPSKTTIKLSSSPSAHANGKTPMTAPLSIRDNFVSAPSSPADRFQTPKTSM